MRDLKQTTLNLILVCSLLWGGQIFGQSDKNEIKANALLLPVGIVNVGYERALSTHWSGQADLLISPWKSFAKNHFQFYIGTGEARYYFKGHMNGWYLGGNLGMGFFDLQKWNYWDTDKFQRGFTFLIGATAGYKAQISEHWKIDLFIRGGNSQGFYHGYKKSESGRYDKASRWNASGEWLPYGGGLMLSYSF